MLNMLFILLNLQFQYIAASTRTDFYHAEATQSIIQYNYSLNYSLDEIFSIKNINSVKMQKHELIGFVSSLNKHAHFPINFINVITNYNPSFFNFYTSLQMILHEGNDQFIIVDNYFNSVNEHIASFTEHAKSYCVDATSSALKFMDFSLDAEETPKNSPKVEENNFYKKTNARSAFLFATAAAAFASGDVVTPVSVVADILSDTMPKEKTTAKEKHKPKLKSSPKENFTSDTFSTYSKLFCINTFSLQFSLDTYDQLTIVADKISYDYFIDFITYTQDKLEADKDLSNSSMLKNIWEQLEVLKRVTTRLETIIAYELYDKIYDLSKARHNPFLKVKNYISIKLSDIDRLKNMLEADFPISKLDLLEQVNLNAATRLINAQIKEEALKKHADELADKRSESDQRVSKNVLQNELNSNEFEAFANLHVYGPLKRTMGLLTRAIIALPEGITVGGLQGIYQFLGSIYNIFSGSPVTTSFITVVALSVIYSSVANILSIVYNFVSWIFFPFLFVKRLVCRIFC